MSNQSINQWNNPSKREKTINQWNDQSFDQSSNQSIEQPIKKGEDNQSISREMAVKRDLQIIFLTLTTVNLGRLRIFDHSFSRNCGSPRKTISLRYSYRILLERSGRMKSWKPTGGSFGPASTNTMIWSWKVCLAALLMCCEKSRISVDSAIDQRHKKISHHEKKFKFLDALKKRRQKSLGLGKSFFLFQNFQILQLVMDSFFHGEKCLPSQRIYTVFRRMSRRHASRPAPTHPALPQPGQSLAAWSASSPSPLPVAIQAAATFSNRWNCSPFGGVRPCNKKIWKFNLIFYLINFFFI